jgi:UDPglucose--hexose-1-phosphate uridylyltransferase
MFNLNSVSHRRLNPLTGEWILVSPHRTARPWLGQIDTVRSEALPSYDPSCYLCPGNERTGGARNPQYSSTFVFDNDFSALQSEFSTSETAATIGDDFIVAHPERGICRVGCFSPRHDLALAEMSVAEIETVVEMWGQQFKELSSLDFIRYVQIFENRGALMGASNPHPHCQIWATASIPNEPAREQRSLANYLGRHNRCLLCDYAEFELTRERLIFENDAFVVVVPFWAVWPFETLIISRQHLPDLAYLGPRASRLAETLQQITRCYDRLFETAFPYSMGFHQQPVDGELHPEAHFHGHFYPPLLRSATIRKFMVGFEMLGSPQRDLTPELAAEKLREACKKIG